MNCSAKTILPVRCFLIVFLFCIINEPVYSQENSTKENSQNSEDSKSEKKEDRCEDIEGDYMLEFKSNGQLISFLPENIIHKKTISARIFLDKAFWTSRIHEVVMHYIITLENLVDFQKKHPVINYGIESGSLECMVDELHTELTNFIDSTLTDNIHKTYYKARINALGHNVSGTKCQTNFIPALDSLINPSFTLEFQFYNLKGNRINILGDVYCDEQEAKLTFQRCCDNQGKLGDDTYYVTNESPCISEKVHEIQYKLRTDNSWNTVIQKRLNSIFPEELSTTLADVKKALDSDFLKEYNSLKEHVKEINSNDSPDTLREKIDSLLTVVNPLVGRLNTSNTHKEWIKTWLWLTKGKAQVNPFEFNRELLFETSSSTPVSSSEKAKYELFEKMLENQAFQVDELQYFEEKFNTLPEIKAKMDASASTNSKASIFSDELLYDGVLKCSFEGMNVYMRHHDAKKDYIIMAPSPVKEITEDERLYVLINNKSGSEKLGITFTAEEITEDYGVNTEELLEEIKLAYKNNPIPHNLPIGIVERFEDLQKKVNALMSLSKAPTLPYLIVQDESANFYTDILEHDYLYEAPAKATYTIYNAKEDGTKEELKTGGYRINKLYRFRFKAGIVYSWLRKNDYTESSSGQYSLDDPNYGIDGTFGVQIFFKKQDIRDEQLKPRLNAFIGLSMRNITDSFYFGLGSEFINGLSIGLTGHLGKREKLVGNNGIPSSIRDTYDLGLGVNILVDGALFVKLFSFGSTNKALLGY